ncbi:polymorphic toxin type 15 domain-containing protein [Jannaschia pohangensis]|uniref:Novel toxin 15 n=1 Tax=Jannaschia pohangensis TaxID=390807 RepID=A0A1I3MXE0_9RHOB|nr:polymorphic toxin type 15 domain-containing protein [Jannaschia pohangensis]SFJ01631.1 Novel toxin 15 [Jannaschia pohangensis]
MAGPLSPAEIGARSERSAYAEATPPRGVCATCRGPVIVRATYDDYWQTPVTRAPLRVWDANGLVFDGDVQTQGLMHFGAADGEVSEATLAELRAYLGTVEAADAQRGGVEVELAADEAALQQAEALSRQIKADLRALAGRMETSLHPWIAEWENDGWWGAIGTFFDGVGQGLTAWWEGEGEFWSAVGDWIAGLPDAIGDAWDSMTEGARALWDNRHRIVELLQALATGAVRTFQQGFDAVARALAEIPGLGEIGQLLSELADRSVEWSAAMIEVATRTDVLRVFAATSLGVLMLVPPNFWAEVVGQGVGFLIPEAIIALLFLAIAAFTGGTAGAGLAVRLTQFAGRIGTQLALRAPRAGRVLGDLFTTLIGLVEKLTDLVKAMLRGRSERRAGTTDTEIPIVRRARIMDQVDPGCFDALGYAERRAPGDPAAQREIVSEYARQLRDQQAGLNDLTVGEYLDAREAYNRLTRSGISDGVAQANARSGLRGEIEESVREGLEAQGMGSNRARIEAERRAREIMSNLAALHDPDMIAGGADRIRRVGDSRVNSSIGGSWGDHKKPTSRISRIDAAAERAAADPSIGRDGRMNTKLEPCRGRR